MSSLLQGKSAVITGAASGVGRAIATRFVMEGARVVALDVSEGKLATLREELGSDLVPVHGDVRQFADNAKAVRAAADAFGGLDVFVGNAGIFDGFKNVVDLTPEQIDAGFDDVFGVNVKGYLLGVKAAVPELAKSRGCIVLTTSTAAFSTGGGGAIYTASKHAVVGLVRELALELAPLGIRVNGVAPGGVVDSDLRTAPSLASSETVPFFTMDQEQREERMRRGSLLGVAGRSEYHAWLYVVLASDQSRLLTGVVVSSDGGMLVKSPRGGG